jgi:hypothetical protein
MQCSAVQSRAEPMKLCKMASASDHCDMIGRARQLPDNNNHNNNTLYKCDTAFSFT